MSFYLLQVAGSTSLQRKEIAETLASFRPAFQELFQLKKKSSMQITKLGTDFNEMKQVFSKEPVVAAGTAVAGTAPAAGGNVVKINHLSEKLSAVDTSLQDKIKSRLQAVESDMADKLKTQLHLELALHSSLKRILTPEQFLHWVSC